MSDTSNGVGNAGYTDIQHHTDIAALHDRLEAWLATRLPPGADPRIGGFEANATNGMSSDTVLFEASWSINGTRHQERFVARIAPEAHDVPVFPRYDLSAQFQVMRTVARTSDVPVPQVWWCEEDPAAIGRPFFLMGRVDGQVPPDVMPYTFGENWLAEATDADRARLEAAMVDVLVQLHTIDDVKARFDFLSLGTTGATPLARHLADTQAWYDWSLAANPRSTLVEAALALLHERLPAEPGPTVLSWGDARIGNVLFVDFEPAAVLDWEMAGLGPRELDVTWLTYSQRVFQDLAGAFELPGLPAFLRSDDVFAAYEAATGHIPRHLDWHLLYAGVRWAMAFLRTGARQALVAGTPLPDDGDELLHNRPSLEQLVAGTFVP